MVLLGNACLLAKPTTARAMAPQKPSFRTVAYLPDYRLAALRPTVVRYITDLIYFSLECTATGDLDTTRITPEAWQKLHTLQAIAHFHLMVAVGGWGHSGSFGPVTASPQPRAHFVQALVQYCRQNHLEGVDFDWEGPANATEEANYAALMVETKRAFQPYHLRLSVAMGSSQPIAPNAITAVDAFHLMAYDHNGRHSTLEQAKADVAFLLKQGVPRSKIILGVPYYGHGIQNWNNTVTYADIVAQYHPHPDVDEAGGLYFNGPKTIQIKTRYALDNGLGGIMIWEIGQDTLDSTSLSQAIHQEIIRHTH